VAYVTLDAAAMLAHSFASGPALEGDVLTVPRSYGKMYDQVTERVGTAPDTGLMMTIAPTPLCGQESVMLMSSV
jgi:hypothetical protein